MRQAMLTERAVTGRSKGAQQEDTALVGVEERILLAEADLEESQFMFRALLPLDPDDQPAALAAESPKKRPAAVTLLPKIMSKETEALLERIRRKQIADLLAKK